jgi:hypothetical protein
MRGCWWRRRNCARRKMHAALALDLNTGLRDKELREMRRGLVHLAVRGVACEARPKAGSRGSSSESVYEFPSTQVGGRAGRGELSKSKTVEILCGATR